MIPYVARERLSPDALYVFAEAVDVVKRIGNSWGNELRCHELARAVARVLLDRNQQRLSSKMITVVDGSLGAIEHSWICVTSRDFDDFALTLNVLDVYCPGRLPQVQILDSHVFISKGYVAGAERVDIRHDIVEKLIHEMTS